MLHTQSDVLIYQLINRSLTDMAASPGEALPGPLWVAFSPSVGTDVSGGS
ncbi:hypothetical protein O9992_25875 [Vibrio lentus]|nr:hypothetical protein [Vibrio lentus]